MFHKKILIDFVRTMEIFEFLFVFSFVIVVMAFLYFCPHVFITKKHTYNDFDLHCLNILCQRVPKCDSGKLIKVFLQCQQHKTMNGFIYMFLADLNKIKIGRTSA